MPMMTTLRAPASLRVTPRRLSPTARAAGPTWVHGMSDKIAQVTKTLWFVSLVACAAMGALRLRKLLRAPAVIEKLQTAKGVEELERVCLQHMKKPMWNAKHQGVTYVFLRCSSCPEEGVPSSKFLKMLASKTESMARAKLLEQEDVEYIAYAIGEFEVKPPELLQPMPILLELIDPKDVSGKVVEAAEAYLRASADGLSDSVLSKLLWATADITVVRARKTEAMEGFVTAVVNRMREAPDKFTAQDVSNALRTATRRRLSKDVMEPVVALVVDRLDEALGTFDEHDLCDAAWAAATVDSAESLVDAVLPGAIQVLVDSPSKSHLRDFSGVLRCCVKYNRIDQSVFQAVFSKCLTSCCRRSRT